MIFFYNEYKIYFFFFFFFGRGAWGGRGAKLSDFLTRNPNLKKIFFLGGGGGKLEYVILFLQGWLVGCFRFNGPLRQYFSLYRAVSRREGERKEKS